MCKCVHLHWMYLPPLCVYSNQDFLASDLDDKAQSALAHLRESAPFCRVLGSYARDSTLVGPVIDTLEALARGSSGGGGGVNAMVRGGGATELSDLSDGVGERDGRRNRVLLKIVQSCVCKVAACEGRGEARGVGLRHGSGLVVVQGLRVSRWGWGWR